jgi:DNA repair exonuclease SbcCD ATPase subunit
LFAEKDRSKQLVEELHEQRMACEALKKEIIECQAQGEARIVEANDERADVNERLHSVEQQLEERTGSEKLAVQRASELQLRIAQLEEANSQSERVVARLKDGSRVAQLESVIEDLTQRLEQKG